MSRPPLPRPEGRTRPPRVPPAPTTPRRIAELFVEHHEPRDRIHILASAYLEHAVPLATALLAARRREGHCPLCGAISPPCACLLGASRIVGAHG